MNNIRTWIEIDNHHFNHNVSQYKKIIGPRNLSLVIKANAYGHGIDQLAQLGEYNSNVHSFCVATVQEAIIARKAGAKKPILVMGLLDQGISRIINKNIALTIYDYESAQYVQSIAAQNNAIMPVHIKIDTGLSRLGMTVENAPQFITYVRSLPNIEIQGIYSHCAESHKKENAFTLAQQSLFLSLIKGLLADGFKFPYIHFANSAATSSLDLPFCNLFRIGIGALGLWPSQENKTITEKRYPGFILKPILTWKTRIIAIKPITKNSFIGYDRTFQAPHDMRIALLPIGYYDGYDFRLYNKGSVLIHGISAPIIGRISMNMASVDITHIPQVQLNDEVRLMGEKPIIHPYTLGQLAGNPNIREMITKLSPTIYRKIIHYSVELEEKIGILNHL
jgi:alanine racemase